MSAASRTSGVARARVALCAAAAGAGAGAAAFLAAPVALGGQANALRPRVPVRAIAAGSATTSGAYAAPAKTPLRPMAAAAALALACCGAASSRARARARVGQRQPLLQARRFFGSAKVDEGDGKNKEPSEKAQAACEKLREEIVDLKFHADEKRTASERLRLEANNFRTRSSKELAAARGKAAIPIIKELLPIADEYELAAQNLKVEGDSEKALCARFDKLYEEMLVSWKELGVDKLASLGEEFDPEFHEAVSMIPSGDYKADVVCNELRGGWVLKPAGSDATQVLRAALVCVSSGPGPS